MNLSSESLRDFPGTERFAIVRRIGAGGMGVVYEAHDRARDVRVALKTLPQIDAHSLYLFKQEFRSLSGMVHPNLAALYELISDGGQWFFTMELVHGENFLDYVRHNHEALADRSTSIQDDFAGASTRPLEYAKDAGGSSGSLAETQKYVPSAKSCSATAEESSTATIVHPGVAQVPDLRNDSRVRLQKPPANLARLREALGQLAGGIHALHQSGKLHRDIKPSNILVTPAGRVVLLDFGLVTDLETRPLDLGDDSGVAGTINYIAPEHAAGHSPSPASDWYAVGIILYQALTGLTPYRGHAGQVLRDKQVVPVTPPSALVSSVPEDLGALCIQLLRIRPEERPSGAEILRRLSAPTVEHETSLDFASRRVPFVGRQRHLATLAEAVQTLEQRRAVMVFVHGRSGVGKTELIERFLEGFTTQQKTVVLTGRCYEQESVPYKALDSLVDALSRYLRRLPQRLVAELLPRDMPALARLFPVLRRVEIVTPAHQQEGAIPDVQELRRRGFAALRELLARLGSQNSLILYIDDLQWGDADSAALLTDLLRPPSPPVLCLLCAYRSEYAATSPCLQALLPTSASADAVYERRELAVEPLTSEEARLLALELLGQVDPEAAARAETISRESGGSPYFVRELVQYLQGGAELTGALAARERITLDEVLWRRVLSLPESSRRLLELVAVAGCPLRQGDAYHAGELDAADRTALAILRAGHLVRSTGPTDQDEVEPFHDRVRETVVARVPVADLKGHHQRLADALEASGRADPETLAVHFCGAENLAKAGRYYSVAADEAAEALAFDRAAKLYQLSLDLCPLEAAEGRMQTKLADALAKAGRCGEAARGYVRAAETASEMERIQLERQAAYQYCIGGYLDDGRTVLQRVLGRCGMRLPGSQWSALLSLLFNRLRLRLRGLRYHERRPEELSDWERARIDVSWAAAAGLGTKNIIVAPAFGSRNLLLALRAGEPYRIGRALAWEAGQVSNDGESAWPWTQQLLGAASSLAERLQDPYLHGLVAMARGIAEFTRGRWKTGRDYLRIADQIFREQCTGVTWERGQANSFMLWCVSYMGDFPDMACRSQALLDEAVEKGDLFTVANMSSFMEPLSLLAADEAEGAKQAIDKVTRQWSQGEYDLQTMLAMMGSTYVDLYRGEAEGAYQRTLQQWPALRKSLLLHAQLIRCVVPELRARSALGVAASGKQVEPALRDAGYWAKRLQRERMPYATALATFLLAGIAAIRRQKEEAIRLLAAAAAQFDATDMSLFAAVARRRQGELLGEQGRVMVEEANAWMLRQNIKNPSRMAQAYAPWQPPGLTEPG
jgi:serine/threonine protein kinase